MSDPTGYWKPSDQKLTTGSCWNHSHQPRHCSSNWQIDIHKYLTYCTLYNFPVLLISLIELICGATAGLNRALTVLLYTLKHVTWHSKLTTGWPVWHKQTKASCRRRVWGRWELDLWCM